MVSELVCYPDDWFLVQNSSHFLVYSNNQTLYKKNVFQSNWKNLSSILLIIRKNSECFFFLSFFLFTNVIACQIKKRKKVMRWNYSFSNPTGYLGETSFFFFINRWKKKRKCFLFYQHLSCAILFTLQP